MLPSTIDHFTDIITKPRAFYFPRFVKPEKFFLPQSRGGGTLKCFFSIADSTWSRGFREQRRTEEDRIVREERERYDKKIARRREKTGAEVAPLKENDAEEIKLTKQSDWIGVSLIVWFFKFSRRNITAIRITFNLSLSAIEVCGIPRHFQVEIISGVIPDKFNFPASEKRSAENWKMDS